MTQPGLIRSACILAFGIPLTTSAFSQCVTGGLGGGFPQPPYYATNGTWDSVLPTGPLVSPLAVTVPAGATVINSVVLNGLHHTWAGDLHFVLQSPNGTNYNLAVIAEASSSSGTSCDTILNGTYMIVDSVTCASSFACFSAGFPPGTYAQTFGAWTDGNAGLHNVSLEQIPLASGTWTLYVYDWFGQDDNGTLASWDICFGSPTPPSSPPTAAPTLTSPANAAHVCASTTLTWTPVACATAYDVDLDGTIYGPITGTGFATPTLAAGGHTWRVRGTSSVGAGPYSTSRTLTSYTTPPYAPSLSAPVNGHNAFGPNITLSWTPPFTCATSYEVDIDGVSYASAGTSYVYSSTPGLHTWMVRGVDSFGPGPWSASTTFNDIGPLLQPCNGPSLPTLSLPFLGGPIGGQIFFDVNVTNAAGITVSQLGTHTNLAVGTAFSMKVYTKSGTYVGFVNNSAAWTLSASGSGISQGLNNPSLIEFTDFVLPPGVTGFALIMVGARHWYSSPPGVSLFYSNADLSITCGAAIGAPWTGTLLSPRVWNGVIHYNCTYSPTSYCASGLTTNGCRAVVSADASPSLSFANACNITVSSVEGQKNGIIFYGLASAAVPWSAGSSSLLCVKPPTQRAVAENSAGTANLCDGTLTMDWNTYQSTHPSALGNPWTAGSSVFVQAWFRDPPAVKTTNLSDGLELTYVP